MTNLGLFLLNWFLPFGGSRPLPFSLGRPILTASCSLGQQQEVGLVAAAWRENTTTYYCFIQEQQPPPILWRKRRNTCFALSHLPYFIPTYKRYSHSPYWGLAISTALAILLCYRKAYHIFVHIRNCGTGKLSCLRLLVGEWSHSTFAENLL